MSKLTDMINDFSRKRDKLRRIDRIEQRAGRMSSYAQVTKDALMERVASLSGPIKVNGVYIALLYEGDFFKNGKDFLDRSNFMNYADKLAIAEGVSETTTHCVFKKSSVYKSSGRMKKLSIRWHMPGDDSFLAIHAGGPGYDFPAHFFVDAYSLFDRVAEKR